MLAPFSLTGSSSSGWFPLWVVGGFGVDTPIGEDGGGSGARSSGVGRRAWAGISLPYRTRAHGVHLGLGLGALLVERLAACCCSDDGVGFEAPPHAYDGALGGEPGFDEDGVDEGVDDEVDDKVDDGVELGGCERAVIGRALSDVHVQVCVHALGGGCAVGVHEPSDQYRAHGIWLFGVSLFLRVPFILGVEPNVLFPPFVVDLVNFILDYALEPDGLDGQHTGVDATGVATFDWLDDDPRLRLEVVEVPHDGVATPVALLLLPSEKHFSTFLRKALEMGNLEI
ncbi:uncharacterized protein PG986_008153 [Apiospora aurea]|uniref:Uncharacterized protein n=1 Tax=Apiospora aurea TaxID=335848 RepID=A0ABR1QG08_9PEZI